MQKAKIFGEAVDRIISATDIKNGVIDKNHEFVDPEYEFKVIYVKGAKNNGSPHFRLYFSKRDYYKLDVERRKKYDILRNMSHFQESKWHRKWEENLSNFCEIERYIKNKNTGQLKRADAYYKDAQTIIELQHSYISNDFSLRNNFYQELGYNVIWLFDLSKANVEEKEKEVYILEDNARGFFKVVEENKNLFDMPVFIQTKNELIYQINCLYRKDIDNDLQSTIRYFKKMKVLNEMEFIDAIRNKEEFIFTPNFKKIPRSIFSIFNLLNNNTLDSLTIKNIHAKHDNIIRVYKDLRNNNLAKHPQFNGIKFRYCYEEDTNCKYNLKHETYYNLNKTDAKENKWVLLFSSRKK